MRDRIRRVFSVYSFVPEYQKEKLKIIAAIRKEVKRKKGQVGDETREKIEEFERYLRVRKPIKPSELPTWVKEQLSDVDGNIDRFVLIWAGGAKADLVNSRNIRDAFGSLYTSEGDGEGRGYLFHYAGGTRCTSPRWAASLVDGFWCHDLYLFGSL